MGLDDIMGKVTDLVGDNADKIKDGVTSAADFIDEKTGGKFSEQIDKVEGLVGDQVAKLSGGADDAAADAADQA